MTAARFSLAAVLAASLAVSGERLRADPPGGSDPPNILFILFTAWGGGSQAGAYGCTWIKTPNFDRVAREGVLFMNAFTPSPKASPSRAAMLTGRDSWQLEQAVSYNSYFPAGYEVYPDLLERSGYFVGMTGFGWDGDFKTLAKRTRNPTGPGFNARKKVPTASGANREDYAGNFGEFLRKRPERRPFCFWMGFHEAHRDFQRGAGLRAGKKLSDVKVPSFLPDLDIVRSDLLDYAVEIESADRQVGRALQILEAAGELENTLIVVTSDRGMAFPFVKDQVHEDGFHVPMAMRWGRVIKPGRKVDDFISMRDLAPTYLEIAGLPVHPQMTGKSLANILRSEKSGWIENRDVMLIGKEGDARGRPHNWGYPVRAIRTREFLYVHNFFPDRYPVETTETDMPADTDNSPSFRAVAALGGYYKDLAFGKRPPDELYRITDDPEDILNLASDLAFGPKMEELKSTMIEMLKAEGDPRLLGQGSVLAAYPYLQTYPGQVLKSYDGWVKSREPELKKTVDGKLKAAPPPFIPSQP